MAGKQFQQVRKSELKSINANFDFSNILRNASNNDYWHNKAGLWTVISAACNDAATEYYVQMSDYIKNLADVDLCNIHALKSIAKSVGCEYLTDFIKEDYPPQLLNLINLLSIPKHELFNSYQKLNLTSISPLIGAIDARNSTLTPSIKGELKYYKSILLDIAANIEKIRQTLIINKFDMDKPIKEIIDQLFSLYSETAFLAQLNLKETLFQNNFYVTLNLITDYRLQKN